MVPDLDKYGLDDTEGRYIYKGDSGGACLLDGAITGVHSLEYRVPVYGISGRDVASFAFRGWALEELVRPRELPQQVPQGTVALAATSQRLYAATSANQLWTRPVSYAGVDWILIGHANAVMALAAGNARLFAVTTDGQLWARDFVDRDQNWRPIGTGATAISVTESLGLLFALTPDGRLLRRVAQEQVLPWQDLGQAPAGAVALIAIGRKLYAFNAAGRSWRRDAGLDADPWVPAETLHDLRFAAAVGDEVYTAANTGTMRARLLSF